MNKLKLLLVDDQRIFVESLKIYLTNYASEMEIIGICSNGKEACDFVEENQPDIILMDVHMPVMDGVEAVAKIKTKYAQIKIIMLSTYDEDESVRKALINGASGYLLKDISPTELIVSIRALNSGMIQISPGIAKKLIQTRYVEKSSAKAQSDSENKDEKFPLFETLTEREREIFALLATGKDNAQIADELGLSSQTVRNHVSTIYSKLDVKDRFEIIQLANKM